MARSFSYSCGKPITWGVAIVSSLWLNHATKEGQEVAMEKYKVHYMKTLGVVKYKS